MNVIPNDVFDDIRAEVRAIRVHLTQTDSSNSTAESGSSEVRWFSTGTDRKELDAEYTEAKDQWDKIEFGFAAKTVSVRTTDDLNVCPVDPSGSAQGTKIRPDIGESPYSLGGDNGIDTEYLWIQAAETATNTPKIEVQAFA